MRPVRSLVILVTVVFLGSGFLAPCLYWPAQSLSHVSPTPAGNPFHPFVKQALPGVTLIGLWPFLRSLGVQSVSDIGLARSAGQWPGLAGMLLGIGYHHTGNLYFSIGLHAGWIFRLKGCRALMTEVPGSAVWWWGTARLIHGWLAFGVLTRVLTFLCRWFRKKDKHSRYGSIYY